MKTMTCKEMGGTCDVAMTAATEKDMMDAGWKHVEEAHPDIVESMKTMSKEDKDAWAAKFHETWEAAPEDSADKAEEADAAPEAEEEEEAA